MAAASSTLLSGSVDEAATRALAIEALVLFEDREDEVGQAFAYELLAFLEHNRVRSIPRLMAAERMLAHARAAGATWLENTAKRLGGTTGRNNSFGFGLIDPAKAVAGTTC